MGTCFPTTKLPENFIDFSGKAEVSLERSLRKLEEDVSKGLGGIGSINNGTGGSGGGGGSGDKSGSKNGSSNNDVSVNAILLLIRNVDELDAVYNAICLISLVITNPPPIFLLHLMDIGYYPGLSLGSSASSPGGSSKLRNTNSSGGRSTSGNQDNSPKSRSPKSRSRVDELSIPPQELEELLQQGLDDILMLQYDSRTEDFSSVRVEVELALLRSSDSQERLGEYLRLFGVQITESRDYLSKLEKLHAKGSMGWCVDKYFKGV